MQTLEPLALHTGLTIEISELLAPDGDARDVLAQLDEEALANAVLCTHGEMMRPLLRHLRRRHVAMSGDPGRRGWLVSKGMAWQLNIADKRRSHRAPRVPADRLTSFMSVSPSEGPRRGGRRRP